MILLVYHEYIDTIDLPIFPFCSYHSMRSVV